MIFDLIVEGKPTSDFLTIPPPELELNKLEWPGNEPPDTIILSGGLALIRVGRYASPGERWRYRVATKAKLVNGQLAPEVTTIFSGES
jgi:hypothetical protein